MARKSNDQEILAILTEKIGDLSERVTYDNRKHLMILNLSKLNIPLLPAEIGQLTNLQQLILANNQLSQLPGEIGQLTNLQQLYLANNQLSQLPAEIGQLTNLQTLIL